MRGLNFIAALIIGGSILDAATVFIQEVNEPLSPLARAARKEYEERRRIAEDERLAKERAADRKAQEERERKREVGEEP